MANNRLQATRKSGAVFVFFHASGAPLLQSPEPERWASWEVAGD